MTRIQPRYVTQPWCSVQFLPEAYEDFDQAAALDIAHSLPHLKEGWERGNSPVPNSAFFQTEGVWLCVRVQDVSNGYAWFVHAQLYFNGDSGVTAEWEFRYVRGEARRAKVIAVVAEGIDAWMDEKLPIILERATTQEA